MTFSSIRKMAAAGLICLLFNTGCGSKSEPGAPAAGEAAQGKMSPEDVQKELQKISPPAAGKGKAKAK